MKFGVLKDIKVGEYRVIATPAEVSMMVSDGHEVYVQRGAGEGSGFGDEAYAAEGAKLVDTMEEIYGTCDFVAKVKEFEPSEYGCFGKIRSCLPVSIRRRTLRRCRRFLTASASHLLRRTATATVPPTVRRRENRAR